MSNNGVEKKKPGRPPKNGGIRSNSGATRKKSDINHPAVQKVFKSLKKVGSNPDSQSIAELICNVVDTDIRGLIPGETITRTQKSIDTLQKINEDMVYGGGGEGYDDNTLPKGLDVEEVKQAEAKDVTDAVDTIKKALPSPEVEEIISLDDEYAEYDNRNKKEKEEGDNIEHGNEEREVVEEVGVI